MNNSPLGETDGEPLCQRERKRELERGREKRKRESEIERDGERGERGEEEREATGVSENNTRSRPSDSQT